MLTDADPNMLELARKKYQNIADPTKLEIFEQNAAGLALPDASVNRLIATHVLEHLEKPVDVLQE